MRQTDIAARRNRNPRIARSLIATALVASSLALWSAEAASAATSPISGSVYSSGEWGVGATTWIKTSNTPVVANFSNLPDTNGTDHQLGVELRVPGGGKWPGTFSLVFFPGAGTMSFSHGPTTGQSFKVAYRRTNICPGCNHNFSGSLTY